MFARVTRFNIRPDSLQQGHHQIEEHLIPALRMQKGYSGDLLLASEEDGKMLAVTLWEDEHRCTPPMRPPTGFESSVLKPSTARSRTSRPTKSTAHDCIIQSRDLTQHATNDPGGVPILSKIACQVLWKPLRGSFSERESDTSEDAPNMTLPTHRRPQQSPPQDRPGSQRTLRSAGSKARSRRRSPP